MTGEQVRGESLRGRRTDGMGEIRTMRRRWRSAENEIDPTPHGPDAARGQAGIALIPALIAMTITAVAVIALFSALTTILLSTGAHRRTVRAGNEATAVIEALKTLDYVGCEGKTNMQTRLKGGGNPVYTDPTGYTASIVSVEYLDDAVTVNPAFNATCTTDRGLQRVTVRVESPGTPDVFEEVVGILRNDNCPPANGPVPGERC